MIEKICEFIVNKMKKKIPDIDEEKAEVLNYGLQLIIGELPKVFFVIAISFLLGIGELTVLAFLAIMPYRAASGGFHLKTHLGCIIATTTLYCGTAFLSKYIILEPVIIKYIIISLVWIFGMIMSKLYSPADTENVPIISKKERTKKRIASYITLTITLLLAALINNNAISNVLIFGMLFQSITITRIAYKITNNKYGHEVYNP